jgi:hypothetical protein
MMKLVVKNERPHIPKFVLPLAQKLIMDFWETEPGGRPWFDDIVD